MPTDDAKRVATGQDWLATVIQAEKCQQATAPTRRREEQRCTPCRRSLWLESRGGGR